MGLFDKKWTEVKDGQPGFVAGVGVFDSRSAQSLLYAVLFMLAMTGCGTAPTHPLVLTNNPNALPVNLSGAVSRSICGTTFFEVNHQVCFESGGYCPAIPNGSYTEGNPPCSYVVLDGHISEVGP